MHYLGVLNELAQFGELKAWARWTAEEINKILEEEGFNIRLNSWPNDGKTFGIAAIYDLLMKWLIIGSTADKNGKQYLINNRPAFRLACVDAHIKFYDVGGVYPLIQIPTKTQGDSVFILKSNEISGFDLLEKIINLRAGVRNGNIKPLYDFGGGIFPNIKFSTEVDMSWLKGLYTDTWYIDQAKMEARFGFGPEGARARVAFVASVMKGGFVFPKPDHVVNYDILLWMDRASVTSVPLFSAFVSKDEFAHETVDIHTI